MITEEWSNIKEAEVFLDQIKRQGITYAKLKKVLFGNHAVQCIALVRKHGQPAFKEITEYHHFWYMVKVALSQFQKP